MRYYFMQFVYLIWKCEVQTFDKQNQGKYIKLLTKKQSSSGWVSTIDMQPKSISHSQPKILNTEYLITEYLIKFHIAIYFTSWPTFYHIIYLLPNVQFGKTTLNISTICLMIQCYVSEMMNYFYQWPISLLWKLLMVICF